MQIQINTDNHIERRDTLSHGKKVIAGSLDRFSDRLIVRLAKKADIGVRTYFTVMVLVLGFLAAGCSSATTTDSETDTGTAADTLFCPLLVAPSPDFCPDGRVEQVITDNGCPMFTCVPTNCPVYQRPECPDGEHVETITDAVGCNVPRCVPSNCPRVALPPADFCPEGERIDPYVNSEGCTNFRCILINCPVYQIPECPQGEHVETVINEEGCKEPVCVSDLDPCPTIAAPDATFCPNGQVMLDETQCQWVCHGGDRCPFIGDFSECQGTAVLEYDPQTYCLTGIDCVD